MGDIIPLITIDYSSLFVSVLTILVGIKTIISLFEWAISKLGLETKWMREKQLNRTVLCPISI